MSVTIDAKQLPHNNTIVSKHYDELLATVKAMTAKGKGLLAADESVGSVSKRFAGINLENTEENRRKYRALMIGAEGIEESISGVIFHEETLGQKMDDGTSFPEYVAKRGIVPGIKTDKGLQPLHNGAPGEQCTDGLDGYLARAEGFYKQGARFCKWRNAYKIQNGTVSEQMIMKNAETLADYAYLSQLAGLVPIVEPEVMIDGAHTQEQCQAVSQRVWAEVTHQLHKRGVIWEAMLLKPNMVVPGAESGVTATPEQVAEYTVRTLARTLPAAVPGVTFLSGGLSEVQATEYLNAMNVATFHGPRPWNLSFSYARALQSSALKAWAGKDENVPVARKVFLHRARMNALANKGEYNRAEDDKQSESLYVAGNSY